MPTLLVALLSVLISVAAQFALKAGMSGAAVRAASTQGGLAVAWAAATSPKVIAGFVLYGLGAVVWLSVLARWDVSKAYPLVGIGFGVTALVGWWLGEAVTLQRAVGVLLICAGVALVARS